MRPLLMIGAGLAAAVFLAPALAPEVGTDALLSAVLPIGFLSAGALAEVLRPSHPIGARLVLVGVLHLGGIDGSLLAQVFRQAPLPAAMVGTLSVLAFAMGFVVLLDLLARYPNGRYAWTGASFVVGAAFVASIVLVVIGVFGTPTTPEILELASMPPNPWFVAALEDVGSVGGAIALAPLLGLVLLVARYPSAPETDRRQMRWPIATTLLVVGGIALTGVLESALGASVQTGLFVALGVALPGSLLVGLLRHSEEAERLAMLEGSRARIAEAEEAERRRIERDLHDGAQQQLIAILARVELARVQLTDEAARAELDQVAEGIREVHRDLRELARGIHPAILTDRGLPEAIASAAARLPMQISVEVAPEVASVRHTPAVEGRRLPVRPRGTGECREACGV
ncbi:MAG: histidine kinase dimerization/phosphoacceptor domain-containing protein [Chloroflexota bacterium]|nr:histidine kinase dimerization/phosphoacceptor domain-containing protein [Chloroflexota bacterium]